MNFKVPDKRSAEILARAARSMDFLVTVGRKQRSRVTGNVWHDVLVFVRNPGLGHSREDLLRRYEARLRKADERLTQRRNAK